MKRTTGMLAIALAVFGYTNCSKLQYDPKDEAVAQSVSKSDLIDVAGACPTGTVPLGITTNRELQCAKVYQQSGAVCPASYYAYSVSGNVVTCLRVLELDRVGSLCPVNHFLRSYTLTGSIVCEAMPIAVNASCDDGYYIRGLQGNTAICEKLPNGGATVPNQCEAGKYLKAIEDGKLVCTDIEWGGYPLVECGSGFALVGFAGNQAVCQKLMNQTTSPQTVCGAGQFALTHDGTTMTCLPEVAVDLTRFCGAGYSLQKITANGFECRPLPNTATKFNGTCGAGRVLGGFQGGTPACRDLSVTGNLPGFCPNGSYPVGISNGALVCKVVSWHRVGVAQCTPLATEVCTTSTGIGYRGCASDGSGWSACVPSICNSGYELVGTECQAVTCQPGSTSTCLVPQGSGTRVCRSDAAGYGVCNVTACNAAFKIENNQCVPIYCAPGTTASCTDGGAYGLKTCNAAGNAYGACTVTGCLTGWTYENGACFDRLAPRLTFIEAPPAIATAAQNLFHVTIAEFESGVQSQECRVDNSAWVACAMPMQIPALTPGPHVFQIRVTDKAGNQSTAAHQWTLQ